MLTMDDEILRLGSIAAHDTRNGGEALLRLAILHLNHPGLDKSSASWVARQLKQALTAFYGSEATAEQAFRLYRGDPRTAITRNGIDPALGVPWAVAIVFTVEERKRQFLEKTGDNNRERSVFSATAAELNRRKPKLTHWTESLVKTIYYEQRDDKDARQGVAELKRRLRIS